MPSCVAFGCTNRPGKKIPGISFHRFPQKQNLRHAWIRACRRVDWAPSRVSILCSEHFNEAQIDRTSVTTVRLRENAVPDIFKAFPSYLQKISVKRKSPLKRIAPVKSKVSTLLSQDGEEARWSGSSSSGVNGLKRQKLKKTAIPSCNLPTLPDCDYTNECENSITLEKTKKLKSNKETPISERLTQYTSKLTCCPDETDYHESIGNREEINETSLSSTVHIKEECVDTSPNIMSPSRMVPNYSDTDAVEHTSENLKKFTRTSTIPHFTIKYRENCDFDHSLFKSSPDDSKEIVTQKLEAMLSAYATLEKKVEFYQNKCKIYEKEVNILKGVIDNLKLINSVAFDN